METIKMNTQELVKATATVSGRTQKDIKEVLEYVEQVVNAQLGQASESQTVEIKVMNGLTVIGEHVAPRVARNPQTGETFMTDPKNRVKTKIGKALKDAVNA